VVGWSWPGAFGWLIQRSCGSDYQSSHRDETGACFRPFGGPTCRGWQAGREAGLEVFAVALEELLAQAAAAVSN
jgi:hypothetical protein